MKYLHLEFSNTSSSILFNTRSPDWGRVCELVRQELMRQYVMKGEDLDLDIRVRFLPDSLGRYVRDDDLMGVINNGE